MKKHGRVVAYASCLVLAACGAAPKPPVDETKTTSAPLVAAAPAQAPAPIAAPVVAGEKKVGDPLALDGAIGALPKIVFTPPKELRRNGPGDLQAAFELANRQASHDAAATQLGKRLGKPTWVENGQKRVWVVTSGSECHRLVLMSDGSVDLDGARRSDWTMLSTFARQNTCSGQIEEEAKE